MLNFTFLQQKNKLIEPFLFCLTKLAFGMYVMQPIQANLNEACIFKTFSTGTIRVLTTPPTQVKYTGVRRLSAI